MPKKTNYTLTTEELQQVKETLTKHRDGRVRSRAQMIYLLHLGKKVSEVAEILMTTQTTVYNWHKRWRQTGLVGLEEQDRPGRPLLGGDEFKEKLEAVLQTDPGDLGYGFTVWTIERLIQHMGQETGVYVSEGTMHNRLADLEFVYRRPKHTLENLQDKDAKKQADALLTELKKRQNQAKSTYSLWTKRP